MSEAITPYTTVAAAGPDMSAIGASPFIPAARKPLSILAPTRYPWRFNGPRQSMHRIENRDFLPMNYISAKVEGVTVFNPLPPRRFDLIHAFNRIPVSRLPYVIGFESHLPRAFGAESGRIWKTLSRMLRAKQCRGIVAISDFARRIFLHQHGGTVSALNDKLHVRYPNMVLPDVEDALNLPAGKPVEGPIRIIFIGNHFARKGGCVAVTMADMARRAGVDLIIDVVSKLEMGQGIWTDPTDAHSFARYVEKLTLPNVHHHRNLPNETVQAMLRQSHFSLLATFGDTFGYSALESMVNYTPVIATAQGALPEFIHDGEDGILLDLPVTPLGEWLHMGRADRDTPAFAAMWQGEVDRLARQALDRVVAICSAPGALGRMRQQARATSERFCALDATRYWDDFYERAVDGPVAGSVPA